MTAQELDDPFDRAPLCCLIGPTASGKTALSIEVARRAGAEILSLDSMQVYRGMDLGTAKPDLEERAGVVHHLIDLVDPDERYDVQRYLADAREVLRDILDRGRRALFVGGTGFYLASLLRGLFEGPPVDLELRTRLEARAAAEGAESMHAELAALDPTSAERLHANDTRRVIRALEVLEQTGRTLSDWQQEWKRTERPREDRARLVGLHLEVEDLDARIRERTTAMLQAGWKEEALAVRSKTGYGPSAIQALGYREVLAWADGELTQEEARDRIALATRQFARRQRTWYRKFQIHWLPPDETHEQRVQQTLQHLAWTD